MAKHKGEVCGDIRGEDGSLKGFLYRVPADEILGPLLVPCQEAQQAIRQFVAVEGEADTAYRQTATPTNQFAFEQTRKRLHELRDLLRGMYNSADPTLYTDFVDMSKEQNIALGRLWQAVESVAEWFDEQWPGRRDRLFSVPTLPAELFNRATNAVNEFLAEAEPADVGPLTEPLTKTRIAALFVQHRNQVDKLVLTKYHHQIEPDGRIRMRVADMPPAYQPEIRRSKE